MNKHALLFIVVLTFSMFSCNDNKKNRYELVIGVNRTELSKAYKGEKYRQIETLYNISESPFECIRLNITDPELMHDIKEQISLCNELGLGVLLNIELSNNYNFYNNFEKDFDDLPTGNLYPYSKINESYYVNNIKDILSYLKDNNCKIDVIEIGDKIGWNNFYNTYPVFSDKMGYIIDHNTSSDSVPDYIINGIRKIGKLTNKTKEISDSIFNEINHPEVILGSLYYPMNSAKWMLSKGGIVVTPEIILKIIKGEIFNKDNCPDYLEKIDGIAVNIYPSIHPKNTDTKSEINRLIDDYFEKWMNMVSPFTNLPIYITECGINKASYEDELDYKRIELLNSVIERIDINKDKYNFRQLYIYSWDQEGWLIIDDYKKTSLSLI